MKYQIRLLLGFDMNSIQLLFFANGAHPQPKSLDIQRWRQEKAEDNQPQKKQKRKTQKDVMDGLGFFLCVIVLI